MPRPKRITILGSTGSIGKSALDVVRNLDGLSVFALSGRSQIDLLKRQANEFSPRYVVAADQGAELPANSQAWADFPPAVDVLTGNEGLIQAATAPEVDIVLAAIVGVAGLPSAMAAVECGKQLALANKETLVVAGHLITQKANQSGSVILPVDSEHSAIYQALQCGRVDEVSKIVLTASGGPFRSMPTESLATVTVEQALAHPTWKMGRKISIDSATMMNKALEIIEAKWLFGLSADQIEVVIHPQSIIHSMVTFSDQSTIAQLSHPDMRLPIQYAFTWPERVPGPAQAMDWTQTHQLEFIPPDLDRFPALKLGFEVAEQGGSAGAVVNAANEAAVDAFLKSELSFTEIVTACREVLEHHHFEAHPTLAQLVAADRWAREEISKWIAA